MARELKAAEERWPLGQVFSIARGSKREAHVVTVEIRQGDALGRGECVPYQRYGETVDTVLDQIHQTRLALEAGMDRAGLQQALPPGAARNALDCALWDLQAKLEHRPVWALAGLDPPAPVATALTISLGEPAAMGRAAAARAHCPVLKVKLGGEGVLERLHAVRTGAPHAELLVDANEAWSPAQLQGLRPELAALGVAVIEQPLPAGADADLTWAGPPVLCADESFHTADDLGRVARRYGMVNIKLDKTGGLTAALTVRNRARALGMDYMVGCMVGSSLAMAPALLLSSGAAYVDLDGPMLLSRDRQPTMADGEFRLRPAEPALWG